MKNIHVFSVRLLLVVGFFSIFTINFFTNKAAAGMTAFITTWQTDVIDPTDSSLTIPVYNDEVYDYTIDWGDGSITTSVSGNASHTYASPGTYSVEISGLFPGVNFNNYPDAPKLLSIDQWGDNEWQDMTDAFEGAINMHINATDTPNMSAVTSMNSIFAGATAMNESVNDWDVSNVINFSYTFYGAHSFDQPLDTWDVSKSQTFLGMFQDARSFNQDIGAWKVGQAYSFNSMFNGAWRFNQPLNNWNTSQVQDVRYMFKNALNFNQPLNNWRLPEVNRVDHMFYGATNFDSDISGWNLGEVPNLNYFLSNTSFSYKNYDLLLIDWAANSKFVSNKTLAVDSANYCNGIFAKQALLAKGWTINDAGEDLSLCGPKDITFLGDEPILLPDGSDTGSLIGDFEVQDEDLEQNHEYRLCDSYTDNAFFVMSNNQLLTSAALSFASASDENGDNVYEICVEVEDITGFIIQKEFSIAITENEEIIVTQGEVLGANTDSEPQNSGSESSNDKKGVLPATDGDVLANTGTNMTIIILVGASLVFLPLFFKKTRRHYKILNNRS